MPSCPLCHHQASHKSFTTNQYHGRYSSSTDLFNYYRCPRCQSYFPDISHINLNQYYFPNYRQPSNLIGKIIDQLNFFFKKKLVDSVLSSKHISILDVGCGNGDFINKFPTNYQTTGIDIKIDKNQSNLIEDDFIKHQFKQKYDLICFWHSLEHFTDPIAAIIKAQKLINDRGAVIISIPVSDSFSFEINPQKAFHLDPPRHTFIPNTLAFKSILYQYFPSVKVTSLLLDFPLDLYWTLKNSSRSYLLPLFPILKLIKPETKIIICKKS